VVINTTTGKWVYESDATRDATALPVVYRANVTHFSAYNLDRPITNSTELKVTVTNNSSPGAFGCGGSQVNKQFGSCMGRTRHDGYGWHIYLSRYSAGDSQCESRFWELKGVGYGYDVQSAGKATMTIALAQLVSKGSSFIGW